MSNFWNINGVSRSKKEWFSLLGDVDSAEITDPALLFLKEWWNDEDYFLANSSGSTGTPKTIKISKSFAIQSALATAKYFDLNDGDNLLLCIPTAFIGGKMMLVRADVCDLNIHSIMPSSSPDIPDGEFHFCSMTPMQLSNVLESNPASLKRIEKILLGGSPAEKSLLDQLQKLDTEVFIGYGMTETSSHVALRNLSKKEQFYQATEGFEFKVNVDDKLEIRHTPSDQIWVSNDIVKLLDSHRFEWLGRADFVINSGGVKIHPEEIESKLQGKISLPFYLSSRQDNTLGQKLVLIVESEDENEDIRREIELVLTELTSLKRPKEIIFQKAFKRTDNGKLIRERLV